jgi:tripartite-type tricarboxylate transporter receptor subunit TctC
MKRLVILLAGLLLTATAIAAYPERPVRIVVTAGIGSVSDVRARWLAGQLAPVLGQPVVVENIPGGSGIVGTRAVAHSAADGYTLLLAHIGNIVVGPLVNENVDYDPATDFLPVSRISKGYAVLTCHPDFPAKSVADLIRYGKDRPGVINWGNTGVGGPPWMMAELFRRQAGIEMTSVQYKGGGELLSDLLAGRIDCWMEGPLIQTQYIKAGKLRALAVTAPERLPFLPDVPTMAQAGLPDFEFQGWTGIVVPAGTPPAVIQRLNAAMRQVLGAPDNREWFREQANVAVEESPEEFAAFLRSQSAKWAPLFRTSGVAAR